MADAHGIAVLRLHDEPETHAICVNTPVNRLHGIGKPQAFREPFKALRYL